MNWDTKDKLQKIGFIVMLIVFIITIGWGYQNCQREVVRNTLYEGFIETHEKMCVKLSSEECFRSSVGRAADL
jgi:hypothetical protein